MARSSYIYLIRKNGEPIAAFTVKHEMETWIRHNPGVYTLYRMADGTNPTVPYGKLPVEMMT